MLETSLHIKIYQLASVKHVKQHGLLNTLLVVICGVEYTGTRLEAPRYYCSTEAAEHLFHFASGFVTTVFKQFVASSSTSSRLSKLLSNL